MDTPFFKLPRLYVLSDIRAQQPIVLDRRQAHRFATVRRANVGAQLRVFNARDGEWLACLQRQNGRLCAVPSAVLRAGTPAPAPWLLFGIPKRAACALIVEKATELGAHRITPVATTFSQPAHRGDRLNGIAIGAAEQCERIDTPIIDPITPLARVPALLGDRACAWAIARQPAQPPGAAFANNPHIGALLIGSEGGFADDEVAFLRAHPHIVPIGLGPNILRSETAAIMLMGCWVAYQLAQAERASTDTMGTP